MNGALVFVRNFEVYTTSEIIAENVLMKHSVIKNLIKKYVDDFEEFGKVRYIIDDKKRIYLLNELQATFLITLLKNSARVVKFKKELVKQFYKMKEEIISKKSVLPTYHIERKGMTDAIKELPETPHKRFKYKIYTDMIYKAVTSQTAKVLKEMRGYKKGAKPQEYLTTDELKKIANLESRVAVLIEAGLEYDKIKEIVNQKLSEKVLKIAG